MFCEHVLSRNLDFRSFRSFYLYLFCYLTADEFTAWLCLIFVLLISGCQKNSEEKSVTLRITLLALMISCDA
jgi:hypothetical protein